MKAMTMHKMADDLEEDGSKKMIVLSARQATLLSSNEQSLRLMLANGFGVGGGGGQPKLVINLMESGGFADYCSSTNEREWKNRQPRWAPGVVSDRAPFTTPAAEKEAESRIDMFMSEVLIPLAAQVRRWS